MAFFQNSTRAKNTKFKHLIKVPRTPQTKADIKEKYFLCLILDQYTQQAEEQIHFFFLPPESWVHLRI